MWQRLGEVMRELSADDALRCIVMRGAGEKAFAAGQRHRGIRAPSAPDVGAGASYGADMHEPCRPIARLPPSDRGADPRHLRRRRARDRGAVRHAHLRRVEPLRRADQEARPRDGLRRDDGPARARGQGGRARDPARGARVRRRGGERQGAGHARRARRRGRGRGAAPPRRASPTARRSSPAGTRNSRAACRDPRRLDAAPNTTRASPASTPRTSGRLSAAFLAKRKPDFKGR